MKLPILVVAVAASLVASCNVKMNGKALWGGGGGSPSSTPGGAAAGNEAAGAGPAWCKELGLPNADPTLEDFANVHADEGTAPVAKNFAQYVCATRKSSDHDQVLALRQQWMKANLLDDQDFYALVVTAMRLSFDDQDLTTFPGPISELYDPYGFARPLEVDQAGPRSMLGRFRAVGHCRNPSTKSGLLGEVLCSREPLDVARAFAEIDRAKELNPGARYSLRSMVRDTARYHAKTRAELAARAKEDPGVAKLLEIADATFEKWATPNARRDELVALVTKMEAATEANKLSTFKGCEVSTRKAWGDHLSTLTLPKVSSEGVLSAMLDTTLASAEGYLAYHALRLCDAGLDNNKYPVMNIVGSEATRRGPRTDTIAAWLAATSEITFDDRALAMSALFKELGIQESHRRQDVRQGVIDKISPYTEGRVSISFRKVVEPREDCLRWVESNRIVMFAQDGRPIYHRSCVKWGKVKWDLTPHDMVIGKTSAIGLQPGMYLYALEKLPIVATPSAKSNKPVWVLGGSLK